MNAATTAKRSAKPVYYEIGEVTLTRHENHFQNGDYSAIARRVDPPTTRATVGNRIKAGTATLELAKAIQEFYADKESTQDALNK